MKKLLTIAIPTYNRLSYLQKCLDQLLPQAERYRNEVEVLITDNCSTDGTQNYLEALKNQYDFITYHRNKENKGYSGNQINCISMAHSKYTAILCDDDAYTSEALDTLLPVLREENYAFIALNYYSFKKDISIPFKSNFAPAVDKVFTRAYDVLNYPSVGHFSGFVFNSEEAKETLCRILETYDFSFYESHRGVINDVACRQLSKSTLPSYFIGKRIVAAFAPEVLDYDSLPHLCIENIRYYTKLYNNNIITKDDLLYRKKLVLDLLPSKAFSSLSNKQSTEVRTYWQQLLELDLITPQNRIILKLIFTAAYFRVSRFFMKKVYRLYRFVKI